ncbi:MAG: hypothetical protein ACE5HI_16765, partial [bacterium]
MLPQTALPQLIIDVVYPREEQVVTASDSTFIFGSVSIPSAHLSVNDITMKVYPNGAFLGVVPVTPGNFVFRCKAKTNSDSVEVERNVFIPPYLINTPRDTLAIDSSYIFPREDLEIGDGDYVQVAFKGTPGHTASFTIRGLVENAPMVEARPGKEFYWGEAVFGQGNALSTPEIEGIYSGVYKIANGIKLNEAEIVFKLNGTDGTDVTAHAPGKLTVCNELIPRIAELGEEWTVARTAPGLGYQLFLPQGIKLHITGKSGEYYRAHLN